MTSRIPEPPSELEEEGIPDMQDTDPRLLAAGDVHETIEPPHDYPVAVNDYGTTLTEMREGESLDDRLGRELPDTGFGGQAEGDPGGGPDVGRLVEPDEGAHADVEGTAVASSVGTDVGGYSPEERAMHIEEGTAVLADPNDLDS